MKLEITIPEDGRQFQAFAGREFDFTRIYAGDD
jgi:hypothetical protein